MKPTKLRVRVDALKARVRATDEAGCVGPGAEILPGGAGLGGEATTRKSAGGGGHGIVVPRVGDVPAAEKNTDTGRGDLGVTVCRERASRGCCRTLALVRGFSATGEKSTKQSTEETASLGCDGADRKRLGASESS